MIDKRAAQFLTLWHRLLALVPEIKWPLISIALGTFFIVSGAAFPEVGGLIVLAIQFLSLFFSQPRTVSRNRNQTDNYSDPGTLFCIGGAFLLIGFGWLAIKYLKNPPEPLAPPE